MMGMRNRAPHLPAGEELALLVGRWGIESPRCEVLAQLLKISAVVTWRIFWWRRML